MISFIDEHRGVFGVEPICRLLPIAPSTYYENVAKRLDVDRLSVRTRRHVGLKIEKPGDVEGALREAIKLKDRTVFLDVRTDPTENVWPMVQAGKGISEMLLGSEDL